MKLKVMLLSLVMMILATPVVANAEVSEDVSKEFWKSSITTLTQEEMFFDEYYEETLIQYTNTGVNMRSFPNVESEVVEVLPMNTEVNVVSEYKWWSKIHVVVDEVDNYYYIWNEYLDDEKVKLPYDGSEYLGNFKLTAYCKCSKCCGKWSGSPTASGAWPSEGRTVAMGGVSFGTKLLINGHIYTVEDRGTPYGHVDIYFESHSACNQFGRQYADVYRVW